MTISDAEFMRNPEMWPRWPLLPILRSKADTGQEWGFLIAEQGLMTTVNVGSLFDIDRVHNAFERKGKTYKYETIEEMVADGWRVD